MSEVLVQDQQLAIDVLREASTWMAQTGKTVSHFWALENLTAEWLGEYATPEQFFCLLVDDVPAAAMVLQVEEQSADWAEIDKGEVVPAMYLHWLCVARSFAGIGKPAEMVRLALTKASQASVGLLRLDTEADEPNKRRMYEELGFTLVAELDEGYRRSVFYEQTVGRQTD